jgi:phosphonate transport system ATP-binding protein
MLQLQQLDKRYPTGDLALKSVSLNVASGEVLGLIGPSGAGKSTLIRCVNRLVQPTAGQIVLDGQDLGQLGSSGLRQARRHIGTSAHRHDFSGIRLG